MNTYRPAGYISAVAALQVVADRALIGDQEAVRTKQKRLTGLVLERLTFREKNDFNAATIESLDCQIEDIQDNISAAWDGIRVTAETLLRDLLFNREVNAVYFHEDLGRKSVPADFWASKAATGALYAGEYYRQRHEVGDVESFTLSILTDELDAALEKRQKRDDPNATSATIAHRPPALREAAIAALNELYPANDFASEKAEALLAKVNELLRSKGNLPLVGTPCGAQSGAFSTAQKVRRTFCAFCDCYAPVVSRRLLASVQRDARRHHATSRSRRP